MERGSGFSPSNHSPSSSAAMLETPNDAVFDPLRRRNTLPESSVQGGTQTLESAFSGLSLSNGYSDNVDLSRNLSAYGNGVDSFWRNDLLNSLSSVQSSSSSSMGLGFLNDGLMNQRGFYNHYNHEHHQRVNLDCDYNGANQNSGLLNDGVMNQIGFCNHYNHEQHHQCMNLDCGYQNSGFLNDGVMNQRGFYSHHNHEQHHQCVNLDCVCNGINQSSGFLRSEQLYNHNFYGNLSRSLVGGYVPERTEVSRPNLYARRSPRNRLNTNQYRLNLEDLRGKIVALAKHQTGCRVLQQKFENPRKEEIDLVLDEVLYEIGDLMKHSFANYLMQTLVAICTEEQRGSILLCLSRQRQFVDVCLDGHGTRVMQKLIEHLERPEHIRFIIRALRSRVYRLITDINGSHVIQQCLKCFPYEDIKYLLNEVVDNCYQIAVDKYGCVVLQLCVEHAQGECRESLLNEIISTALHLTQDHYGNYVVQHVMQLKDPEVSWRLIGRLENDYVNLSMNKYGSNVVEKFLVESNYEQKVRILEKFLESSSLSSLLTDPFGNFVIQTALRVSKGFGMVHQHRQLVSLIQMNVRSMRSDPFGKKVLAWFRQK